MEDPFEQLSNKTAGQTAVGVRQSRRESNMFNSVKVDPANFQAMAFCQSRPRKEFVEGENIPDDQKAQKHTKDGVPVWTVEVTAVPAAGYTRTIRVNVPSEIDPAERFQPLEQVVLSDMEYGVAARRNKCELCGNSGYSLWMTAGSIEPATATRPHTVSSVA